MTLVINPPSSGAAAGILPSGDATGVKDTAAIQAAINAAQPAGSGGIGLVQLQGGNFTIKKLTIPSRVVLAGAGAGITVLTLAAGVNDNAIEGALFQSLTGGTSNAGIVQFGIRDLTVDGNRANNAAPIANGGRCIAFYGSQYAISNVVVRNAATDGFYSEWFGPGVFPTGGSDPLEDFTDSWAQYIKAHSCGGHGMWLFGPHDSVYTDCVSFFNGQTANASNIRAEGQGHHFVSCHAFGGPANYAWELRGHNLLVDCIGEGALLAQFWAEYTEVSIIGGECYTPGSSTGIGVLVAQFAQDLLIEGLRIFGFSSTSGAAIDLTATTKTDTTGVRITAQIEQASGTAIAGTPPPDAQLDILVTDGAGGTAGSILPGAKRSGTATLVAGAVTVADTHVTANTILRLNRRTTGGTLGELSYTLTAGASFTIHSSAAETSTVVWEVVSY